MRHGHGRSFATGVVLFLSLSLATWAQNHGSVGREVAIARHLQDGEEFEFSIPKLIDFGAKTLAGPLDDSGRSRATAHKRNRFAAGWGQLNFRTVTYAKTTEAIDFAPL